MTRMTEDLASNGLELYHALYAAITAWHGADAGEQAPVSELARELAQIAEASPYLQRMACHDVAEAA